ncbi:metallophosphoesterase [Sinomicrobium kalidii]|uniref:metallophosphoesterase family protein n=1 Tax=Sinomicrobium kalidii TaxID=2900738 RepID=UPI001E2DAF87|nr:metallophosphoesterase [Sinomicrobium kalidii]UGU16850.1 metallophosphoesterase [Sinomicrobium kalidii]
MIIRAISFTFLFSVFTVSGFCQSPSAPDMRIAFLADVHLQDIYGKFSDNDYKGVLNPETGKYTLARTMGSQLRSTRIFNENYFAFRTALEDIAEKDIKLVALPGDYTDDGQPIHIRGLRRILKAYEDEYHIRFFITTGNHDPVGPFLQDAEKTDFLGKDGKNQVITSRKRDTDRGELPPVVTRDIAKSGYREIMEALKNFGFSPRPDDYYWATPFSAYTPKNYSYKKALEASALKNRMYDIIPGFPVPDASYLVEPVEGLWLLALDGDVHIPKDKTTAPPVPENYGGAGIGYRNVLSHKQHLVDWVKKIAAQAKERGKTLIAFSHFPMIDFNDDASPLLKQLIGKKKWQLERVPPEEVAETFAKAGLRIHVGGHMHINDTGTRKYKDGNWLVNIQTPSPAAYMPGYKILTIHRDNHIEVETMPLREVADFQNLFPLYEQEFQYLHKHQLREWDKSILNTLSFHDFTLSHLKELVRLRFINDWPGHFRDSVLHFNGRDFLMQTIGTTGQSVKELDKRLKQADLKMEDFETWKGQDLLLDFYKIRNADKLAFPDIPATRIKQYEFLATQYKDLPENNKLQSRLKLFFECLDRFMHGAPADHFTIDPHSGTLTELK